MRTTEELVADFKAATFDKLRAAICAQIWEQAPKYERDKTNSRHPTYLGAQYRGYYVSEILANGGVDLPPSGRWVNDAITMTKAGVSADLFWEQTTTDTAAQPMSLNTALRLYRKAVERAKHEHTSVEAAGAKVLAEYLALPVVNRLPDGRYVRKASPARLRPVAEPVPKQKAKSVTHHVTAAKEDWQAVRDVLSAMVERRLKDTEPAVREQLWRRFENDLRVLFDEFSSALKNATENERKTRSVTLATMHKHAVQACATLMIDPPKRGHPVNLRKADKQKKMLARQYHPDASGTDETRGPYEAVLAAFEVCESYNAQVSVERPELVVHQGGKQ